MRRASTHFILRNPATIFLPRSSERFFRPPSMRGLFLSAVFIFLMVSGVSAPFIGGLAYVWVDIVKPQGLAYSVINGMPLAFISGVVTVALYMLMDRKDPPKFTVVLWLIAFLALWITLTSAIADERLQKFAWIKWDWVVKVLVFALFLPYLFRTRVQMEALIGVIVLSVATLFFAAGVKTALGGGGYGVLALMGAENTGLAEGSTLATVCVMLIPLMLFLLRDSLIVPKNRYTTVLILGLVTIAILAVVGTTARTGLIAGALLLGKYILRTNRKILWITALAATLGVLQASGAFTSVWASRMSTVNTYNQDSSALGRIAVWNWTLSFVADHPLGGGFDAYRLNGIASVTEQGINYYEPNIFGGKAFHNVYFEVLGEQGVVGFIAYASILLITLFRLWKLRKKCGSDPELRWAKELATALGDAINVFMVGGCFVGIAYQPFIFYMIALAISLEQYVQRYQLTDVQRVGV